MPPLPFGNGGLIPGKRLPSSLFPHGHDGGEGSRRPTMSSASFDTGTLAEQTLGPPSAVACVPLAAAVIRTETSVPLSEEDYSFVVSNFRGDGLDRRKAQHLRFWLQAGQETGIDETSGGERRFIRQGHLHGNNLCPDHGRQRHQNLQTFIRDLAAAHTIAPQIEEMLAKFLGLRIVSGRVA